MTSSTYRTLEMRRLDPNYMSVKFHNFSIIPIGFRDHSFHPNLTKKKLKSQKNRPNSRTELMGVPLRVQPSTEKIYEAIKCHRTSNLTLIIRYHHGSSDDDDDCLSIKSSKSEVNIENINFGTTRKISKKNYSNFPYFEGDF